MLKSVGNRERAISDQDFSVLWRIQSSTMSTGAGSIWETLRLIEIWGQESIQKQLQECRRNQTVYKAVAKEMREAGYERTYTSSAEIR